MSQVAPITGIDGQEGTILQNFFLRRLQRVYGADRRSSDVGNWHLRELGIEKDVKIYYGPS